MMARSAKGSNQRPDTLMQDRTSCQLEEVLLQRTAGPYIGVKLGRAGDVRRTTAVPPKADVHPRSCYVAEVPTTVIGAGSLDHLVGSGEATACSGKSWRAC